MPQEFPDITDFMLQMTSSLEEVARNIDRESANQLLEEILNAKRIYLAGAGRSGLVARAFAQRLMHLGFESYAIGETITPAFRSGDVLIAVSGSGETRWSLTPARPPGNSGDGLPYHLNTRLEHRPYRRLHCRDREQPAQRPGASKRL